MTENKYFPNIPVTHWNKLRVQLKRSIPGSITSNYIASVLGMTETSAKANVMPSLRIVGLIDENDTTDQELAKAFRDDARYKDFCNQILKSVYPQGVLDAFPDSESSKEGVKTWFMNHSGVGSSAAQRIVAFYFTLLEANLIPEIKESKNKSTKPKKVDAKIKLENKTTEIKETPINPTPKSQESDTNTNQKLPGLNINVQIHVSSDATPDQIEKIFESMAKHIYKSI